MKQMPKDPSDDNFDNASQSVPCSPAFSEDGVDLTLIRWMLSLSPADRLAVLQANVRSIVRLRNARSHS